MSKSTDVNAFGKNKNIKIFDLFYTDKERNYVSKIEKLDKNNKYTMIKEMFMIF